MKRMFPFFFSIAGLACCVAPSAYAEQRVYLLARVSIPNTTWTEAVFLYDKDADTIAACEQDIARGQLGQWQYYGHLVRKRKGVATTITYKCLATDLSISEWMSDNRYSYVYLIDRRNQHLKVMPHENYAACLTALHRTQKEEGGEFYCAKSNQVIGPV
jgi:hypothetical protein